MSSESPTPGPPTTKPPIFMGINIFIDPGMTGRPQLIKMLRDHGMTKLCFAPKDAQIILVSLSTNSGRQFVRDWGTDPTKVILRSAWVQECIGKGRALLENEKWGGFVAEDDGLPIEDEGDDDDIAPEQLSAQIPSYTQSQRSTNVPNPLPATPHTTSTMLAPNSPPKLLRSVPTPPSLKAQKTTVQQAQTNSTHIGQAPVVNPGTFRDHPLQANGISPSPSPSTLQFSQHHVPLNNNVASQPISIPQAHNIYQPLPPTNIVPHDYQVGYTQVPSGSGQTQVNGTSGYLPQSQSGPFTQVPIPSQTPMPPHPPMPFIPPMSGQYPPVQDPYTMHTVTYGNILNPFHSQPMQPYSLPYTGAYPSMPPPSDVSMTSPSPRRQNSDEESLPERKTRRRKVKRKVKSEEQATQMKAEETEELHQIPEHPSQSQKPLKRGGGPKFFIQESGEPLEFFFQVEGMPNRSSVVKETKNRGGHIVADVARADYAVLRAGSKEFKTAYTQCKHGGTPAVKINFILDCLDEGKVLDWHAYSFDDDIEPSPVKQRSKKSGAGRRPSTPVIKEKKPVVKRAAEERPTREKKGKKPKIESSEEEDSSDGPPLKKQKSYMPTKPVFNNTISSHAIPPPSSPSESNHRRSPSPPPAHTRKLFTEGKYYYTEQDMACGAEYVQVLLERDINTSSQTLSQKLHEKMPYHSSRSWATRMRELDVEGKREKIARRIRLHGTPYGKSDIQQLPQPPDTPNSMLSRKAERRAAEDFDRIVDFFTSGGGDEGEDEEVWDRLEKMRPCSSADSWPDFYSKNKPAIDDAIKEFVHRKDAQIN